MRKYLNIPLLLLLTINIAAPYAALMYRQHLVRREMKAIIRSQINEESLVRINETLHKNHIHWEEENREFVFNSEMFDVVKIKIENGNRIIYCLKDKDEEKLLKDYSRSVHNSASKSARSKLMMKFYQPDIIEYFPSESISLSQLINKPSSFFESDIIKRLEDVKIKPPRV